MSLNLRPHSVSPRKSARIKLVDDESKIEETGINLEKIIHLKDLKIGILEAKYSDLKIRSQEIINKLRKEMKLSIRKRNSIIQGGLEKARFLEEILVEKELKISALLEDLETARRPTISLRSKGAPIDATLPTTEVTEQKPPLEESKKLVVNPKTPPLPKAKKGVERKRRSTIKRSLKIGIEETLASLQGDSKKLEEFVLSPGMNNDNRGLVWTYLIGNNSYITPKLFNILKDRTQSHYILDYDKYFIKSYNYIEKDLDRTLVGKTEELKNPQMMAKIKQVLHCHSFHRNDLGYVQGMNYYAAIMCIYCQSDDDAFSNFSNLLKVSIIYDAFVVNMSALESKALFLNELLKDILPKIQIRIKKGNVPLQMFIFDSLLSLFAIYFSLETTIRIWDIVFINIEQNLYRVLIGIIKALKKTIMDTPPEEIQNILKHPADHVQETLIIKTIVELKITDEKFKKVKARVKKMKGKQI